VAIRMFILVASVRSWVWLLRRKGSRAGSRCWLSSGGRARPARARPAFGFGRARCLSSDRRLALQLNMASRSFGAMLKLLSRGILS
jgi:hypothetical protein